MPVAQSAMQDAQKGQVRETAAQIYESFFVPALFGEWASRVAEAAELAPGNAVLDVACGTGILARTAHDLVAPHGNVTGLDRNSGMLAVAAQRTPQIDWHEGLAEALPFDDHTFDAVISQFGLMFFEDRQKALGEMWRVLKPGGRLVVAVWDRQENAPGYLAMTQLLERLFGNKVADALRAPYNMGDTTHLKAAICDAGIPDAEIATVDGTARFASIADWVHTDIKGWTLADMIDDDQYQTLLAEAERELQAFVCDDGSVRFVHPAHIVTATRPQSGNA